LLAFLEDHPDTLPPRAAVSVTPEEKEKLTLLARRPKTSQALALRARIVLAIESGLNNNQVAAKLAVTKPTVGKWRERFRLNRLEGLLDEPRPGAPRSITDKQVEALCAARLAHRRARTRASHAQLPRSAQRRSEAIRLDRQCRHDSRQGRANLSTNL
jgi:transposase